MFFDSHAHYYDARFAREYEGGADALLKKLFFENVSHIINIGDSLKSSKQCIAQAARYPQMYTAVGIHPSSAGTECDMDTARRALCDLLDDAEKNKIVAVGEIGFDYHYDDTDRETQRAYFEMQMRVAEMYGLPVVIHDREAHGDCFDMVCKYPKVRGVFHSYSGSAEMAADLIRRGWIVSFSGVVTFKNAERVRAVVKSVPMDKLLIETDCPYLAPHPHRGECNHSGLLAYTAAAIGELHGIDADEVGRITAENAAAFFGITL